ncbi:MAG: hypothetical protein QNJ78_15985 [Gammaproteobacteria bacterium]|nr:hypothetical protein [Gammaproteobacteria bacterium]
MQLTRRLSLHFDTTNPALPLLVAAPWNSRPDTSLGIDTIALSTEHTRPNSEQWVAV